MVYISAVADNSTSSVQETTESVNDPNYCQGMKKNYFRKPLIPIYTYHPEVIFEKSLFIEKSLVSGRGNSRLHERLKDV